MIEQQSTPPAIYCSTHNRPKQAVVAVCLEHSCTAKSLLCAECLADYHKEHKHISMAHFLENYSLCTNDTSVNALCLKSREMLEQLKGLCLRRIEQLRRSVNTHLTETEEKVVAFFEATETSIINETVQYQNCSPMRMSMTSTAATEQEVRPSLILKRQIQQYLKNRHYHYQLCHQLEEISQKIQREVNTFSEVTDKLQQFVTDNISETKDLFKEVVFQFDQLQLDPLEEPLSPEKRPYNIVMKWSETLKHPSIELTNGIFATRVSQDTEYNSICCLTENVLTELPPRLYMWTVKIVNLASLMLIGICQQKAALKTNLVRGYWANISHGHYVVGSDGYTYSHSDKAVNYKRHTFRLAKGDLIKLCYDSGRRKLEILCNGQKKWQFNVLPAVNDCYRACVYLLDVGDCIEFHTK